MTENATEILYEVDDPVATITLNRPETLNALTYPMLAAFREAVTKAERDARVVGIVVTGAGRGFCSGLDASVLQATTTTGSSSRVKTDEVPGLFTWLLGIRKPVICAVNGVAAGGGFVLTVMCDLRIASSAGSFTSIFSKRGLIAEHGTTWIVPRLVGAGAARIFARGRCAPLAHPPACRRCRRAATSSHEVQGQCAQRPGRPFSLAEGDARGGSRTQGGLVKGGGASPFAENAPSFPRLGE